MPHACLPQIYPEQLPQALLGLRDDMHAFLSEALRFPSTSGNEKAFTLFVAQFARQHGLQADLWQADETQLTGFPLQFGKHIPLQDRPTLVLRLPGGPGPSLIFNAHADVVAPGNPAAWSAGPFSGTERAGTFISRGACDVKGPLAAALWAMLALQAACGDALPADILLELVPGEEDCVGLGTLTSIARGYRADAAIVLEPTTNLPRPASRPGCRFTITCHGRAIHGTVKWLGQDAIALLREVLAILQNLEQLYHDPQAEQLFAPYPLARPITVDAVHGGPGQGIVCEEATCGGYFELLPRDDMNQWKERFTADLRAALPERDRGRVAVSFSEEYHGHTGDVSEALCVAARQAVADAGRPWLPWAAFNAGCEAGVRRLLHGTPTLVWGPGDLAHAHAADEHIALADVAAAADLFARTCLLWGRRNVQPC